MENEEIKSEVQTQIKVGVSQLKKDTPPWMSKTANGVIFACLAWALLSPSLTEIPATIQADITRWLMIGSGFIKLATKFFGLNIKESE